MLEGKKLMTESVWGFRLEMDWRKRGWGWVGVGGKKTRSKHPELEGWQRGSKI